MKKSLGAKTYLPTTPVLLVGTYDKQEKPNIMTAAWGGICCSKPPCVAVSLRKATYTYSSLVERKAFTIGIPMAAQIKEADYAGIATGNKVDKFKEMGFTAVKSELVDAPYAEEIPFVLECKLIESIELGLHTLFVGEIIDVKADEKVLAEDGLPDIKKINPFIFDSVHSGYMGIGDFLGKAFSVGKR
jgi:flavin reductase (DIM6/NTAB) family NADH-FMN oxidoreductase RutF